jgi:hypothetical protein
MSFPPESPQDYCDYFQGLVLHDQPPQSKWEFGLQASQLWRAYWDQGGGPQNNHILISIVKILMPVRGRGSGLLDLWQRILRHVAKMSVGEQSPIWLEVFDVVNQGEDPIKHNETAVHILQKWIALESGAEVAEISKQTMINMADKIYMYTFSGYDWIAFTVAISEWFKNYIAEPSFYDLVCDKFGKKPNGLEAA